MRKRGFGKRGLEDSTYFLIFQIIAAFIIGIVIFAALRGFVNSTTFWKKYYATDLALMAEIEGINQGDFSMNYVLKDTSSTLLKKTHILGDNPIEIALKKNSIEALDPMNDDITQPISFPFAVSRSIDVIEGSVLDGLIVLS